MIKKLVAEKNFWKVLSRKKITSPVKKGINRLVDKLIY